MSLVKISDEVKKKVYDSGFACGAKGEYFAPFPTGAILKIDWEAGLEAGLAKFEADLMASVTEGRRKPQRKGGTTR